MSLMKSLFLLLKAACRSATENASATAQAELGLHGAQAQTLLILREAGPCRLSDVAAATHTGRPAATTLVQRMEEAGLVTREANESDARASVIALTPKGKTAAQRMATLVGRFDEQLGQGMKQPELAAVRHFLARVAAIESFTGQS